MTVALRMTATEGPTHSPLARPFRAEAWVDGSTAHALVLAQAPGDVVALALRHDAARNLWEEAAGLLPHAAMRAPREAVSAALAVRPATRAGALRFGLHGRPHDMARFLHGIVCGDLGGRPGSSELPSLSESLSAARPDRAREMGYEGLTAPGVEADPPRCPLPSGLPLSLATLHTLPAEAFAAARGVHAPGPALGEVLAPLRDLLATRLDPRVAAILPARHWSPRGEAFYAAPGEAGIRRRQAGSLYPVLAPMIAHMPAIGDLVDAGRPYEAALVRALAAGLPAGADPSPAFLRRLRALPGDISYGTLVEVVTTALALPLDWLPRDPLGWARFLALHRGLARFADILGLAPSDLARDAARWWRAPAPGDDYAAAAWLDGLEEARDMARRCSQTLVEPLLRRPAGADATRTAGRALFSGLASAGVIARARAWHEDLPRFDRAFPGTCVEGGWPALFLDFEAGEGLRITVLTTPGALQDEGSRLRDAAGMVGLDHCVGGYARDCRTGRSHVVSVRRVFRGGRQERLSTAELALSGDGLRVRQHRGRRNGPPPEEAARALDRLLAAVAAGEVTLAPDATTSRPLDAAGEPDRAAPAAIAAAMRAWRPHLPRAAPREDPAALAAWLAQRAPVPARP